MFKLSFLNNDASQIPSLTFNKKIFCIRLFFAIIFLAKTILVGYYTIYVSVVRGCKIKYAYNYISMLFYSFYLDTKLSYLSQM